MCNECITLGYVYDERRRCLIVPIIDTTKMIVEQATLERGSETTVGSGELGTIPKENQPRVDEEDSPQQTHASGCLSWYLSDLWS